MFTDHKANTLWTFYKKKNFNQVHKAILSAFDGFNKKVYVNLTAGPLKEIETFLDIFFYFMLQKDFLLGPYCKNYLLYITLLENLTYLSSFQSTERILKKLLSASNTEIHKILLLLNMKIDVDFNLVDNLFEQDSILGSYWLYSVFNRHSFCNNQVSKNLIILQKKLLNYNLYPFDTISSVYFNSTYINPEDHLLVREKINRVIKNYISFPPVTNTSRLNSVPKIAVLSKNWQSNHAVYKCIHPFIESLRDVCDLSLIQVGSSNGSKIPDDFKHVYTVGKSGNFVEYHSIALNNFNMVIFTDVGLNTESLVLSNLRIAPIQISMYGHPVSTGSNEIDYFFVGEQSETEHIEKYYSEKTVTIEGPGMNSIKPEVKRPTFEEKSQCLHSEVIHIFVSASAPKINVLIKHYWQRIVSEANKKIILNFLPGNAGMQELSVLKYELEIFLGKENFNLHRRKAYKGYMNIIKQCDLAIGSYHYGDYNRVVDALWMGTPFIAVQGECGYQNTGVGALRVIGLDELIAGGLDEYITKALELIEDDEKRKQLQKKILLLNLENRLIHNPDYIMSFKSHIERLLQAG